MRPTDGSVRLNGLQVTNPNAPMTNLFEADEILVDLLLEPLLSKKVVVQDLVVTGVRFNTPRETSGALENPDPESGALFREVDAWANQIDLPPLSLDGLSTVVRTDAISTDSLRTVQHARALVDRADSLRSGWQDRLESLDPRPRIDSLRAVVQRLEDFSLTPLNATRVPGLVRDGRNALDRLTDLEEEIAALDDDVRAGVGSLRSAAGEFQELRARDLAYARGLLDLPSLDAPDISPALFGGTALTWLKPVLYWAQKAEGFLPPGLDPRNRPGPKRARAEGTTVEFPGRATYPSFLLERGELGLEIAGDGPAAGQYTANLRNLTSQPSLVGRPIELLAGRAESAQGPEGLSLAAVLDHTTETIRDSVSLTLDGIGLPALDLDAFDARVDLGLGNAAFDLRRVGDEIDARMHWSSDDISWLRAGAAASDTDDDAPRTLAQSLSGTSADDLRTGSAEWARDFLWRAVSGLDQVSLTMGLSGSLSDPSLSVQSNIGSAVAESLRRELGREIEAAEARLREEVDSRIQPLVQDARSRVETAETQILDRVAAQRAEVEAMRERLEARIDELVPGVDHSERIDGSPVGDLLHHRGDLVHIDGLLQTIDGTEVEDLSTDLVGRAAGDRDHRDTRGLGGLLDPLERRDAGPTRHLDVEEDHVRP
ncbi:MAG: hypothetical protein U5R14_15620 [Gemmatimonadota bacterium]|nr:hypothetical protein [Gemmatimonadota bacterium]